MLVMLEREKLVTGMLLVIDCPGSDLGLRLSSNWGMLCELTRGVRSIVMGLLSMLYWCCGELPISVFTDVTGGGVRMPRPSSKESVCCL